MDEPAYFHCLHSDRAMFTYRLSKLRRAYMENETSIKIGAMVRMPIQCGFYEKKNYHQ